MNPISIRVVERLLSDHSPVYDVVVSQDDITITHHACSQADAIACADKIAAALNHHTTDLAIAL